MSKRPNNEKSLNAVKLGLAGGILWSASLFIMTLLAVLTGYPESWLMQWSYLYPGYAISLQGSLIGLVCGFVDGFIGLFLLAWLYNKLDLR